MARRGVREANLQRKLHALELQMQRAHGQVTGQRELVQAVRREQPGRNAKAALRAVAIDDQLVLCRDQQRVVAAQTGDRLTQGPAAAAEVLEQLVVTEMQLGAGAQRRGWILE